MMEISESGCSAIGMASFSSSVALCCGGAEGGGAAVPAGTGLAEFVWPREELTDKDRLSSAVRMMLHLRKIKEALPDQRAGLAGILPELL